MKKITGNRLQVTVRRILQLLFVLFLFLYPIPYTLYPTFAHSPIPIGEKFGFGDIRSLGEGTQRLVTPFFSIAAFLVVLYFLLGAFKYLKSGGDKEEIAGARQMITHSIIGFVILMFAFLVLQFLLSSLFRIEFKIIG